ncbi:MAG TPA: iron hydrogenase, partial [Lachnospiraceae bacterium]|nr:iron hydrogenase [Lachnospiraceae bacterium]
IHEDENGCAEIDQSKCVSCGQCLANCPFGAIADKAQIFQTIQAIRSDVPVYAAIAPAFIGQFGPEMTPKKIRSAFRALGFEDAVEVAIGADLCTISEAEDFMREVPDEKPFMATSCCPAWSVMAKRDFPEQGKCISMALTPMVLTGRLLKKNHPGCKVAFIGPCSAKKLEAMRRSIRSDIDFVLTFEEVMGMFDAKDVNFAELEEDHSMHGASADGRGFAVGGGVAHAVAEYIKENYPGVEVQTERADGLENCKKMLMLAKAGKYNGYLLEGMACPGGCVAGAGTIQPIAKSVGSVSNAMKASSNEHSSTSIYADVLNSLEEGDTKAPEEE